MHDIDRTQRELEMEMGHEHEHELEHEHEHELEAEAEGEAFLGALFGEAEHEHEFEHEHEHEMEHEHELEMEAHEAESPLHEAQEMELASELLEVGNEAELEYFFGKLASMAARGIKNFARSSTGKALGGMVKGFAKKALPIAGRALGTYFGGPAGGNIGGQLGNFASGLFEMELEGLSHEDREFEVARRVVRLGAAAVNRAARTPVRSAPPQLVARKAFKAAARTHAPGLVRGVVSRGGVRRIGASAPCATCGKHRGFHARRRYRGSPTSYVRRAGSRVVGVGGGTRVINGGGGTIVTPPPSYVDGSVYTGEPAGYDEPSPSYPGNGAAAAPSASASYGGSRGRWYRRGRHIILTGL